MAPHWVSSPAEARAAVDEEAAKKVDIIKIWVDDRMGMVKKLTPDIYGAAIDEAHKKGIRTITHIYTLEDAKGMLRAGVDAFAHDVRDKDVDDEFMALVKKNPNFVIGPNMPDRGSGPTSASCAPACPRLNSPKSTPRTRTTRRRTSSGPSRRGTSPS
jgi:imidazolonepropionase-like amidohydrolase